MVWLAHRQSLFWAFGPRMEARAVLVRLPNQQGGSKVHPVEYEEGWTVWRVKVAISLYSGVPPSKQNLFFNEKELDVGSYLCPLTFVDPLLIEQ